MRFLIGLLLGFALGFSGALLFAPERGGRSNGRPMAAPGSAPVRRQWDVPPVDEELRAAASEDHDFTEGLQRALRSLQDRIQEAWGEARQAAREAEEEMRQRYRRTASRREK